MSAINYTALSNTIWRLNKSMELPARFNDKDMVYLITCSDEAIVVNGYFPKADGDMIVPEDELKQGNCWIGLTSVAFLDYAPGEDDPKEIVRLFNRLREMKYSVFHVELRKPDFELKFTGELYTYLTTKPVSL